MSYLANRINYLFKQAKHLHGPQHTMLQNGLYIKAHHQRQEFFIWREKGEWKPGEAAEREARTCAKALGWTGYSLRWSGRYLIVEAAPALLLERAE